MERAARSPAVLTWGEIKSVSFTERCALRTRGGMKGKYIGGGGEMLWAMRTRGGRQEK